MMQERYQEVYNAVQAAGPRIARMGAWPAWITANSLLDRVPTPEGYASGFDAGIACALDLIPRNRQKLAATLHAAYTPEAVEQVRQELQNLRPDDETTWWLAACHVCLEKELTFVEFCQQIFTFTPYIDDEDARLQAAKAAYTDMQTAYFVENDIAFATRDGGMQGAYLAGYDLAGMYNQDLDLYFIGTYLPSLGLEDFAWEHPANVDALEAQDRLGRSGPVHGSHQFVKCASRAEYERALRAVKL